MKLGMKSTFIMAEIKIVCKMGSFIYVFKCISAKITGKIRLLFIVVYSRILIDRESRAYVEFFVFLSWREHMTNKSRICHVLTPSETNAKFICLVLTPPELFVMFV